MAVPGIRIHSATIPIAGREARGRLSRVTVSTSFAVNFKDMKMVSELQYMFAYISYNIVC